MRLIRKLLIPPFMMFLLCLLGCSCQGTKLAPEISEPKLRFDATQFVKQEVSGGFRKLPVRAYLNLPYVENPTDPEHQLLNLYVPDAYYNGVGVGAFNSVTAPILVIYSAPDYLPTLPANWDEKTKPQEGQPDLLGLALSKGYVVVSPAVRGRTSPKGKAPAPVIDLKAVIRYLRFNDPYIAGDGKKIILTGVGRGAGLAAVVGASGDHPDYSRELEALGAAPASDEIFAIVAYSPIMNLEHADAAYEWQFAGIEEYPKQNSSPLPMNDPQAQLEKFTAEQRLVSIKLKEMFPSYVNSLKLTDPQGRSLTLNDQGEGTFKEYLVAQFIDSAQQSLKKKKNLDPVAWLKIEAGMVQSLDYAAYIRELGRLRPPPAFDAFDQSTPENELFGNEMFPKRHFTPLGAHYGLPKGAKTAEEQTVRVMNPMNYLGQPNSKVAPHWRIRHGSQDREAPSAIPLVFALSLKNQKIDVDFAFAWNQGHSGFYDLDELFRWLEQTSKLPPQDQK